MQTGSMRGVYPILVMPFDDASRVDVESLQRLVEFQVQTGVHGIGVALGSEVMKLTEDERVLVTRTVVDQTRKRMPVVINSGGTCTELALHYSRLAEENGADALMLMQPPNTSGGAQVREYYKAVSDAVSIPIFIQDTSSSHVSADLALKIAEESEHVTHIKVESAPTPAMVADVMAKAGESLVPFGGAGGNYFIEEMRRGSQGTMPGCSNPEAFVKVWHLFQSGDERGAKDTFYRSVLPINRLAGQGWGAFYHVHKEILRQRGVISTANVRGPMAPLDEATCRELQQLIDEFYPT